MNFSLLGVDFNPMENTRCDLQCRYVRCSRSLKTKQKNNYSGNKGEPGCFPLEIKHSDQRLLEQTALKEGEQDKHVPTEIQIVMFFFF